VGAVVIVVLFSAVPAIIHLVQRRKAGVTKPAVEKPVAE
jgi:hypothetical protein